MLPQIIRLKTPKGEGWLSLGPMTMLGYDAHVWGHLDTGIAVISAVEVVTDPGEPSKGPEYHISITQNWHRCPSHLAKWALREFDMEGAEEDNHVPGGKARHFWLPVAENLIGLECPCKKTEPAIKEDKGDYIWRGT